MIGRAYRAAFAATAVPAAALATLVAPAVPSQAPSDLVMVLADQTFTVQPGTTWHVVFDVLGDPAVLSSVTSTTATTTTTTVAGDEPVDGGNPAAAERQSIGSLRITAGRPVATRAQLASALDGVTPPAAARIELPLAPALSAAESSPGTASTITVDVPTTDDVNTTTALTLRDPGLYPIDVAVVVDGTVVAEHRTFVERLPTATDATNPTAGPMNVAIVAGTADPGPAAGEAELARGRRDLAAIAALAQAVVGPITVSVPPSLVSGLATTDPALAATLRTALVEDEVLALPADVMDPSSLVAIDEQPAFTRELVAGEDTLAGALPVPPTRESGWFAGGPISTPAAVMMRNLGFRSLVLPPDFYDGLEGSIGGFLDRTLGIEVDLEDGSRFPAKVPDVAGALLDPAAIDDQRSTVDAAVEIAASLVTTRRELGPQRRRSAVLMTPSGVVPDAEVSATLARFISTIPDFALATMSTLPGATETMVVVGRGPVVVELPGTAGPDISARREPLELTRAVCEGTGSMIVGDDTTVTTWRRQLDTLLSTALTAAEVTVGLARLNAESDGVRSQVELPRPFTFTLTGRSSPLRLNLRNLSTDPLRVVVIPSSPKLRFPDGPMDVVLTPESVTEVAIPVEARSNGTAPVEVRVVTPELQQDIAPPIVLTARVNALTGLGQVVTGAALLVLLSWWYGHFRRRRRARLAALAINGQTAADVLEHFSPDAAEAGTPRLFDLDTDDTVDTSGPLRRPASQAPGSETRAGNLPDP